jgi:hypothetical protein
MYRIRLEASIPVLLSTVLLPLLILVFCPQTTRADEKQTTAHWAFDKVSADMIVDDARNLSDHVFGKYSLVEGVEGSSLRFDGFRTYVHRQAEDVPKIADNFTIEAWIALAEYPWFWAPVIELRNDTFDRAQLHRGALGRLSIDYYRIFLFFLRPDR